MREITQLKSPIDVQYLMHEAYCAVSLRVEGMAAALQSGGGMQPLRDAFSAWGKHLLYHARVEDAHMTGPLAESEARDNEAEHAALAVRAGTVTGLYAASERGHALGRTVSLEGRFALEGLEHAELERRLVDIDEQLQRELGEGALGVRRRRHVYSSLVALRVAEFDHFENEETFVLPLVRERFDEDAELDLARRCLIDDSASDPGWIIDAVAVELSPAKRTLLRDLEARF